jgi:hypothetical protein
MDSFIFKGSKKFVQIFGGDPLVKDHLKTKNIKAGLLR